LLIDVLFPFNLLFLPEIWGLAHRIDPSAITSVTKNGSLGGVAIRFRNESGWIEAFTVWSRKGSELVTAIEQLTCAHSKPSEDERPNHTDGPESAH
jgi:hypothetical protein